MFTKDQIKDIYPLNPMQEGMLFHALLDKTSRAYFMQSSFSLKGNFVTEIAEKSLNLLFERYDILRTAFLTEGLSRPLQVVLHERKADFQYLDFTQITDVVVRKKACEDYKENDINLSFDLSNDVLMRMTVLKIDSDEYEVIWSNHHILMDGWCSTILIQEFMYLYRCLENSTTPTLPNTEPYKNYIKWIEKQNKEVGLAYWKEYLAGYQQNVLIPGLKSSDVSEGDYKIEHEVLTFSEDVSEALNKFVIKNQVTLPIFLQTIWGILLSRYNNSRDVVMGTIVSGRPPEVKGVESMIGLFINTVPVRVQYEATTTFTELLKTVRTDISRSGSYQYFNLADIQASSLQKQNLINHVFVSGNSSLSANMGQLAGKNQAETAFSLSNMEGVEQTHYDFCVYIQSDKKVSVSFDFNPNVYDAALVHNIAKHFRNLVEQVLAKCNFKIDELHLLSASEISELWSLGNPVSSLIKTPLLLESFEKQVKSFPQKTALNYSEKRWTYQELLNEVDKLSVYLINSFGDTKQQNIAVCLDRSELSVISLLAIWKVGATYLPIDPTHPIERRKHILNENGVSIVLTQQAYLTSFEGASIQAIDVDEALQNGSKYGKIDFENVSTTDIAYIIYTSGTTGLPKGIPVRHESIANRIAYHNQYLNISEEDNILHFSSLNFDASLVEILMALSTGATLTIADASLKSNVHFLKNLIDNQQVTVAIITPAYLKILERSPLPSLRTIISTGEAATLSESIYYAQTKQVVNGYGPTEACIGATFYTINPNKSADYITKGAIPIGKPFANTGVYLLDNQNRLVPAGLVGEICISGIGLTNSYINNPELTSEKFIKNPFATNEQNQILYKTGDLAKWDLSDGSLEYLGRKDEQVQIRGIRVELGEIENLLLKHHALTDVKVIALQKENADTSIVAFIIENNKVDNSEIYQYLSLHLPAYMLPSQIVKVDAFPVTINGKIDIKALQQIAKAQHEMVEKIAPQNELENTIATHWKEILGVENISINDNFFEIGGHSLHAIKLVSRLYKETKVKLEIKDIFTYPTIHRLAEYLKDQTHEKFEVINAIAPQQLYPLSQAQWRIWVMEQLGQGANAYHISQAFRLSGNLNQDAFSKALQVIVERHESLRTRFLVIEDETFQQVIEPENVPNIVSFQKLNFDENLEEIIAKEASQPFDLTEGCLIRVNLYETSPNDSILIFTMHHIISDGWSCSVLLNEVVTLYNAFAKGENYSLTPLRIQYKDFAAWQKLQFESSWYKEAKTFWLKEFEGAIPVLEMPTDFKRPAYKNYQGKIAYGSINADAQTQIQALAREQNASMFMVLTAIVKVLLYRYSGQTDLVVGTPIAGRNHADLENQIGVFINVLALRNQIQPTDNFNTFLQKFKEKTLLAYQYQEYPTDQLINDLALGRDTSRSPLFDVMVSVQAAFNNDQLSMDGLVLEGMGVENLSSKFDLDFTFQEGPEKLGIQLKYNTDLFTEQYALRMIEHLTELVHDIFAQPTLSIEKLNITSKEEKIYLTEGVNNTFRAYPEHLTVIDLFEQQVEKTPNAVAIVFEDNELTYIQLNNQANQIANYLIANYSTRPDDLIGIIVDRSERMFVGILGILKSGAAYVPIDPDYPQDRVQFLMSDSQMKLILTDISLDTITEECNLPVIHLIKDVHFFNQMSDENLCISINTSQLAYIIYTSGSTGKPKGVMVEHGNLTNVALAWRRQYELGNFTVKLLQIASISFDVFVGDMCRALLNGGKLVVCPADIKVDAQDLYQLVNHHQINILESTPTVVLPLMQYIHDKNLAYSWMKLLILGADICPKEDFKKLLKYFGNTIRILNSYGTTETTIDSSFYETNYANLYEGGSVPIGKPMDNMTYLLLDSNQNIVPFGLIGELYIGGSSVARGYLNRPELTNERFIQNPFDSSDRLYRTGDLARWLPDGNLEFIGRGDDQVKIRGYRIELGEIETAIYTHTSVVQAVVCAKKNAFGEKILVAYIEVSDTIPTSSEWRAFLNEHLPEYMIPTFYVEMKEWQITPNGKLDRRHLPELEMNLEPMITFALPENRTQEQLLAIWQEVLGKDTIGINDNLFEIGGSSLTAMRILSKIKKVFNTEFRMQDVFLYSSIKEMDDKIQGKKALSDEEINSKINSLQSQLGTVKDSDNYLTKLIHSDILQENYTIFIKIPDNYQEYEQYPVLYILDADEYFEIAVQQLQVLKAEVDFQMPIVIGVSEGAKIGDELNKRKRDFTPTISSVKGQEGSGGGHRFLGFIETELIPFVEQNYSTNCEKSIYGYSYGGLFSAYAMIQRPNLFQKVLMGSPALDYDNGVLFNLYTDSEDVLKPDIVLIANSLEKTEISNNEKFIDLIQQKYQPNLNISDFILEGHNHYTGQIEALTYCLSKAYQGDFVIA
jgi:fengycin family lipopeptide synthetase D